MPHINVRAIYMIAHFAAAACVQAAVPCDAFHASKCMESVAAADGSSTVSHAWRIHNGTACRQGLADESGTIRQVARVGSTPDRSDSLNSEQVPAASACPCGQAWHCLGLLAHTRGNGATAVRWLQAAAVAPDTSLLPTVWSNLAGALQSASRLRESDAALGRAEELVLAALEYVPPSAGSKAAENSTDVLISPSMQTVPTEQRMQRAGRELHERFSVQQLRQ